MEIPETQYAWNGDAALAYQILGEGPIDIVLQLGYSSHLDLNWTSPHLSRSYNGWAGTAGSSCPTAAGSACPNATHRPTYLPWR